MDAQNEQAKDLPPELLVALQDLARLSHRSRQNDANEPFLVASALLERLQQLCQTTHGAIFLAEDYSGRGPSPFLNGLHYRPLALHGIEEKDVDVFLTVLPTEMLWTSRPTLHPVWLVWRLPLVLPFSFLQNDSGKRQEREYVADPVYVSQVCLLFGWERQDEEQQTMALERGRLLLPLLADAVESVLVQALAYEYIHELETRADRKALQGMELLKAELLASVSHELRSPLTSIKGYAATLLRHEQRISREERHEFLLAINEASDRLAKVIDALLEMSELETGSIEIERTPVDLTSVVQEALAVAERKLEGAGEIASSLQKRFTFEALTGPPTNQKLIIQVDRNRLREVLDHLLENAVHHMPEGGAIRLLVRLIRSAEEMNELFAFSQDGGARLALAKQRYQRMIVIGVQDSGKGIPEEMLERIFDPFYRVDTRLTREVNGLGLGLALCRRIIELHDGIIWAESKVGKGSTFFVCLPLDEKGRDYR